MSSLSIRWSVERVADARVHLTEPVTRRIAAFAIGAAVESSPSAFAEFGVAAIEPLFAVIGPIDSENHALLAARDNAVSACESNRYSAIATS